MLSLLGNPVAQKPNYRLYLVAKLPSLKVIDFRKIKPRVKCLFVSSLFLVLHLMLIFMIQQEKAEARQMFGGGKKGEKVRFLFEHAPTKLVLILCHSGLLPKAPSKTFVPGQPSDAEIQAQNAKIKVRLLQFVRA